MTGRADKNTGPTYKDLAKVWAQKEPEKAPEAPAVGRLGTAHDRRNWLRKQAGWPQPKRHSEEGTN